MGNFVVIKGCLTILFDIIVFIFFINKILFKTNSFSSKFIAKTALFSAVSVILYTVPFFQISLPIFPNFLKIHLDEIPALISSFAYGPMSGFFVIFIKTVCKLPFSETLTIGEFIDLLYSLVFIIPASLIYKKKRNFKGALLSLLVGSVIQVIFASIITTFVMLDVYTMIMPGLNKETILGICRVIYPNTKNLSSSFLFMFAVPFNLLKNIIVVAITIITYKKIHLVMDKI